MSKEKPKRKMLQVVLPEDLIEKIHKDAESLELTITAYLRILFRQKRPKIIIDGAQKEKVAS